MIKKQLRIIIIGVIGFVVLTALFMLIVKPVFIDISDETTPAYVGSLKKMFGISDPRKIGEGISMLDGETLGNSERFLMLPQVLKKDISLVEVKNKDTSFKVHHLQENGEDFYYVEGAELVPTNPETLSSFYVNVGYLLAMTRVAGQDIEDGNELLDNLAQYGLDPASDPSWFRVTPFTGDPYRVFLGDLIPTGAGYYVMLEGRNAVYVLDTGVGDNILNSKNQLLLPYVTIPIAQNEYFYIDKFQYFRDGELFFQVDQGVPEDGAIIKYEMMHPAPYKPSSENYDSVLRTFISFIGESVVETDINEETLKKYGIDKMSHRLKFDYKGTEYDVIFSAKNENGKYYVLSQQFGSIVEVNPYNENDPSYMQFLEWGLIKFVDKPIFSKNINDVASITMEYTDESTGKARKSVYVLEGEGADDVFVIKATDAAKGMTDKKLDTKKFRQFYKSILYVEIQNEEVMPAGVDPMLTMTIKMDKGQVYKYDFYFTSTRRCFFTVNGEGNFFILREKVLKLIKDNDLALADLDIIADAPE